MRTSLQLRWIMQSSLAPFPGCQGSCGIASNGPDGSVVSFNVYIYTYMYIYIHIYVCQWLKCKHVALAPTLTMWLLCSNCALPWITKFLECIFKETPAALSSGPDVLYWIFLQNGKMVTFLRSLLSILQLWLFYVAIVSLIPYLFDS